MKKRMEELIICALEQKYGIKFEGKVWIDLVIYMRLNEICGEDLKNGR